MCELFGLSGSLATTTTLSMERLARRGDRGGHLSDGWGIGFYDGPDVRLFREPEPAGDSVWVRFIGERQIKSHLVMSHLRHATQGEVSLRNTQPFARELGGRMHLFAHNGRFPGIEQRFEGAGQRHAAIGSTDSEIAFCALLDRLTPLWVAGSPTLEARLAVVSCLAQELRQLGPANFLYADGELLFAHGHRRLQPDGSTAAPGLHVLHREMDTPNSLSPSARAVLTAVAGREDRRALAPDLPAAAQRAVLRSLVQHGLLEEEVGELRMTLAGLAAIGAPAPVAAPTVRPGLRNAAQAAVAAWKGGARP